MFVTTLLSAMLVMALSGCEKEGPAEKAGKEIDSAMGEAQTQLEAAGNKIENALQ